METIGSIASVTLDITSPLEMKAMNLEFNKITLRYIFGFSIAIARNNDKILRAIAGKVHVDKKIQKLT